MSGLVPWHVAAKRRTHSVHSSREEAVAAAHDLARLMNGVPFGWQFGVHERMGKWAFVSFQQVPA